MNNPIEFGILREITGSIHFWFEHPSRGHYVAGVFNEPLTFIIIDMCNTSFYKVITPNGVHCFDAYDVRDFSKNL